MDETRPQRIPRILHQIWWTGQLPDRYAAWRAGWIANHPDWIHRLYDHARMLEIVRDRAPQWLRTYNAFPRMIQKLDFFRYLVVYLDGGLYADVDMISYQSCDPLLVDTSCALTIEHHLSKRLQAEFGYSRPWQLANFVFAAAPGHPFFAALLEKIAQQRTISTPSDDNVEDISGPRMLTRLAFLLPAQQRGEIKLLPQLHLNPPFFYPRFGPLARRIYARHMCVGSWRTQRDSRPWSRRFLPKGPFPNPFAATRPFFLE